MDTPKEDCSINDSASFTLKEGHSSLKIERKTEKKIPSNDSV